MTPLNFDANNAGADTMPKDGSFHIYLYTYTKFLNKFVYEDAAQMTCIFPDWETAHDSSSFNLIWNDEGWHCFPWTNG